MSERSGLEKAALYLSCPVEQDIDALADQVKRRAAAISAHLPETVHQIVSERVRRGMVTLPHQRVMANSPKPFDIVYQLSSAVREDMSLMTGAVADLGRQLMADEQLFTGAVLVGQEIAITAGDGPVLVVMPLRRLPALTHEEFMTHWFDRHATLGEAVAGVRYRQNHIDHAQTEWLAGQIGVTFEPMDGLAESYFDGTEQAVALLSRDEVAVGAIDDEKLFIDHSRSQFGVNRVIWSNL